MDPMSEEQLDYGDEEFGGSQKIHFQDGRGSIPALAEDDDDEFDDLYNDVNVGDGFFQTLPKPSDHPPPPPAINGAFNPSSLNGVGAEGIDSRPESKPSNIDRAPDLAPEIRAPDLGNLGILGILRGTQTAAPPNRAGLIGIRPAMMNSDENPRLAVGPAETNGGQTTLFVGELHWWTTDAEIESVLSSYGRVKEIRFFDERASGKSKGYCQVEFFEHVAAAACKDGMNGHLFNGRACVVTFVSPTSLRQMNAGYVNKAQPPLQPQQPQQPGRRPPNDGNNRINYQSGDGGRNFGRGGWGRGFNRAGPMRGRGGFGARGMGVGPAGGPGNPYGQGFAGPVGGMMHPQSMMGAGFDPTFMGRGAPYGGGFSSPFQGMMPSFQAVNAVGLPGVAPHVNPAFFGRGMGVNGMGMMVGGGMEGMWADMSMGGWGGEEHGRRTRESSHGGDDGGSEYGYGEVNAERGGRERGSEREWSGNSERRNRDERDEDQDRFDRERPREEKDGYRDQRQRDRERDSDGNYERGQSSSRPRNKQQMMQEEDHRGRSRDADYTKRRRLPLE